MHLRLFRSVGARPRTRGQSLAEFALVFPVLMLVIGGIVQFGIIFWAQNTLTQVVRDTGRWAATQQDCSNATAVIATANSIAGQSSLIGYTAGSWTATNVTVVWPPTDGPDPGSAPDPCPPTNNQELGWVQISITHTVPIFFPFVPGNGVISTSAQFRMEPRP
jgi:uncharacterized protein (UPF0333 family)